MRKSPNLQQLRDGFGLTRGLSDEFVQACERGEMPLEALKRLVTPQGRDTMDAIVQKIIADWRAELPQPSVAEGIVGHPFRGTMMMPTRNIILVHDLPANELIALAKTRCNLTYIDPDYEKWDMFQGLDGKVISGRSKTFKSLVWKPGREVSSNEVREYFKAKGFAGHAAAFTAWVMENKPAGYHASIPDDNGCWRDSGRLLYAPDSIFGDGSRRLDHDWVAHGWVDSWCFVGFREL